MDLSAHAEQLESLYADLNKARADYLGGYAEALRLAPIYGSHAHLMDRSLVAELREAVQSDPDARPLLSATVRAQIEGGTAPVADRLRDNLDRAVVRTLSEKWFFLDAEKRIREECNRKQRKVLDQSRRRVLARQEGDFQQSIQSAHTLMVDRGFTGWSALCAELSGIDMDGLIDTADDFLEDTGHRFTEVLSGYLREAGVFPEDARLHDIIYLFAGQFGPAAGFPDGAEAIETTLADMGLPLNETPGLAVDSGAREGKKPGTHLIAEKVPEAVHLITEKPTGWDDWPELLGAYGLGVALARTPASLPAVRRSFPHPLLTSAFAAVFASLAGNAEWLARHAPDVKVDEQVRRFHLWWLYRVRELAGYARFVPFLHGPGEVDEKADPYEHYMHKATGVRYERDNYLHRTKPFMDQALALSGHFFAGQLLDVLEEKFGPAWFAEKGAGKWLCDLWAEGWDDPLRIAASCAVDDPGNIWPLTARLERVVGEFTDGD